MIEDQKSQFEWPCAKRKAHGSHDREEVGTYASQGRFGGSPVYADGSGGVTLDSRCPGVRTHPNCMIGREVPRG